MKTALSIIILTLSQLSSAAEVTLSSLITNETTHKRLCGELLVGMAIAGSKSSKSHPDKEKEMRSLASETGVHAGFFLKDSEGISLDIKSEIRRHVLIVEKGDKDVHLSLLTGCMSAAKVNIKKYSANQIKEMKSAVDVMLR